MSLPLTLDREGPVAVLTVNRPEARNALNGEELYALFEQHCAALQADMTVGCAILTGAGTAFSAGGDVKAMRDRAGMFGGGPGEIRARYDTGIQRIPRALWELEVPLIAAINGPAIGAGLDLACLCDIRIAADDAIFAESFVRLGIVPGDGGAWLLPRAVGLSRACEMAFTGEAMRAPEALSCGLVSRVVPGESLMAEARALANKIAANPPQVLRWTKRLIREGQNTDLRSVLQMSATFQELAHRTADHAEAISAFFEKRPGQWQGR